MDTERVQGIPHVTYPSRNGNAEKLLDKTARVVVLGDPGVGKTSLIIAATESFDPSPPACLPPTRLPPTFENIPLLAIDTSSRSEHRPSIETLIEGADVILLCYGIDNTDSIRHLRTYWLPEIRRLKSHLPIVICGCRLDLAPDETTFGQQRKFLEELLKEFREVETAIECSARLMQFVQEVFHFALKAVCHPQHPLYDTINQRLKPRCAQALRRIFILCDRDQDNRMDEAELNDFQVRSFGFPLQPEEVRGVFETVKNVLPTGLHGQALTVSGFLLLHALFMERGAYESTWRVLRRFGYTNELTLSDELLEGVPFDHPSDQVLQLSDKAIDFLKAWFLKLDEMQSKTVQEAKIHARMEETSPERLWIGPLWENLMVSVAPIGHITLQGFLSKWHYAMLSDPKTCLKQLLYMGWANESVPSLYTLSKHRRQERRDHTTRSILQCWVFGEDGEEKRSLVKALTGPGDMQKTENGVEDPEEVVAVDTISLSNMSKTLAMMEVSSQRVNRLISKSEEEKEQRPFDSVDIAVFVYSSEDRRSFNEAQNLLLKVSEAAGDHLPCLLICVKKNQTTGAGLKETVRQLCEELKIRLPIEILLQSGELNDVFRTIVKTAIHPTLDTIPETPARKAQRMRKLWTRRLVVVGGVVSVAAVFTVYVYPKLKSKESQTLVELKGPRF